MRVFIRRFLDVDGGANALSAPDMGLGELDEICADLQWPALEDVEGRKSMLYRAVYPTLPLAGSLPAAAPGPYSLHAHRAMAAARYKQQHARGAPSPSSHLEAACRRVAV